jgi:hypothetical protein
MYLEAVAILPQIFMFHQQSRDKGGMVEVSKFNRNREKCGIGFYFSMKNEIEIFIISFYLQYYASPHFII